MKKYWFLRICNTKNEEVFDKLKELDTNFKKLSDSIVITSREISLEELNNKGIEICELPLTSLNISNLLHAIFKEGYTINRINFMESKASYINGVLSIFDTVKVNDSRLKQDLVNSIFREIRYEMIEEENSIRSISIKQDSLVSDTPILFEFYGYDTIDINEELMYESLELLSKVF